MDQQPGAGDLVVVIVVIDNGKHMLYNGSMKQDIPYLEYTAGLLYAYMLAGLKQHQRKADRIMALIILGGALVCLLSAVGILPTGSVAPAAAGYHRAMAGL